MLKKILDAGMNPNLDTVIFSYGDTIYNPGRRDIPDELIEHESTHMRQQGNNPDAWWDRYIKEPYFRLNQEIEAYTAQYDFICQKVKDRNQRLRILLQLVNVVAGPTYGNMISCLDAHNLIRHKSKTHQ